MIDLQLKKARLDQQQQAAGDVTPTQTGTGVVLSRNDLLARIRAPEQNTKTD